MAILLLVVVLVLVLSPDLVVHFVIHFVVSSATINHQLSNHPPAFGTLVTACYGCKTKIPNINAGCYGVTDKTPCGLPPAGKEFRAPGGRFGPKVPGSPVVLSSHSSDSASVFLPILFAFLCGLCVSAFNSGRPLSAFQFSAFQLLFSGFTLQQLPQ